MKRYVKTFVAPIILLVTVAAFTYYVSKHPEVTDRLKHIPLSTLALLVVLNILAFGCYILVTRASLNLYNKSMGKQENVLFNAYSALINFFGPGQSGPVFRGAYLKKRLNLGVKQYIFATLIYYGFFAVVSVLFIFVGSQPWWVTAPLVIATAVFSIFVMSWYKKRASKSISGAHLDPAHIGWIGLAALLQLCIQAITYGVELHTIGSGASIGQVLSYSGVANLTIFVALTPGAIGIREAFLLFSERLHHIGSTDIVAANIVDRGAYLVFLGLLFVLVISLHAKKKLHVNELKTQKK